MPILSKRATPKPHADMYNAPIYRNSANGVVNAFKYVLSLPSYAP